MGSSAWSSSSALVHRPCSRRWTTSSYADSDQVRAGVIRGSMNGEPKAPVIIGRYALYDEIASGGMATVHIGRLLGPVGFSRTVAIKRLHPQFAKDPDFVSMFLDEARLAARIRHPNVIGTLDVVALEGELFLVMEYVPGESLARLWRTTFESGRSIPLPIVSAILVGVLDGLHAAHEATDDNDEPLGIVHRDVSSQHPGGHRRHRASPRL